MNFDDMKLSVESLSGGKNTIILDDQGMPSVMVRIPRFNLNAVIDGAPDVPHPAFIVNGVTKEEILISKFQNIVLNDRAYSLPFKDPRTSVTFDQATTYCNNKGVGHHLMTNAEWAAVALWCKKNNFMPRGNNNYGKDISAAYETGVKINGDKVATGSGPVSWAHNNSNDGIFDLNGNVNEWVGGLRTNAGEIHVIENNDAAIQGIDQSLNSIEWKAISSIDGSLLAPGSADTLKYDGTAVPKIVTTVTTTASVNTIFETLAAEVGITVPTVMKSLGLAPLDASHGGDRFYIDSAGERLALRGGSWSFTSDAGVFVLGLYNPRTITNSSLGFRSAYVI